MTPLTVQIIGPGKAGLSFYNALRNQGWEMRDPLGRGDSLMSISEGVDLVLITTPDRSVIDIAHSLPKSDAVVAHIAGSLGLDALHPHEKRGSIHPLVSLPNPDVGTQRLLNDAWFATAGDPLMGNIVQLFGGTNFNVPDEDRTLYHATACIASNHLVVLLEQVRRLAEVINIPFEAFLNLSKGSLESVLKLGPQGALTGPVTRKDKETLRAHLESLPEGELPLYKICIEEAKRLVKED